MTHYQRRCKGVEEARDGWPTQTKGVARLQAEKNQPPPGDELDAKYLLLDPHPLLGTFSLHE